METKHQTRDPLMAGVINSGKRRKGWMTSADVFDAAKLRAVTDAAIPEITRLVAEHNAALRAHLLAQSPAASLRAIAGTSQEQEG